MRIMNEASSLQRGFILENVTFDQMIEIWLISNRQTYFDVYIQPRLRELMEGYAYFLSFL